jgi:hypothetical protein
MSELLEPVMVGIPHAPEKCPFCPKDDNTQHYKTYKGADNNGGKLGDLVNEPAKFGKSIEADARPKDEAMGKDARQNQSFADTDGERLAKIKGEDKDWKFQCHHAISGNQCLKGHDVEKFIVAGDKLKYDTGYSVNNPQQGLWMPSFPEDGKWPSDPAAKFELAKKAMDKFKRQFHLGHHNIALDPDKMDLLTDQKYVDYVKSQLKRVNILLSGWEAHCPEMTDDGKHIGNPRIHAQLDSVSKHIIGLLTGTPDKWVTFVSRHARDYTLQIRKPNVKIDFAKS